MLNVENGIYYVSCINTDKVLIMDSNNKGVIKEIITGSRPQNIATDNMGNVYIANDNQITVIHNLDFITSWNMPNNGSFQVDFINKKIYVSNTDEVCIYDLEAGNKIASISGFDAADCIVYDKKINGLYILDILKKEIMVYDVEKLRLIDSYKNIGIAPCEFLLDEGKRNLVIANKGLKGRKYGCSINIIDINTKKATNIDMPKNSDIKSLAQDGNYIFAANSGLNKIEVLDIENKQLLTEITILLPGLRKICLSQDKQILYAISKNNDEESSAIFIIEKNSYVIIDTLYLETNEPYDIKEVNIDQYNKPQIFMKL